jgi:TolA-binding protein
MKRTLFYAAVILSTSTFLIQCVATQQDVEYTNVKVRQMDTKVAGMDKEIDSLKKQTMESAQAREAATGERLEYQQSEIMRLQGEIEENNFLSRQIREENRELKQLLLNRLAASDSKRDEDINRLAERLALIDEQLRKAAERVNLAENEIKGIKEARSQEAAQRAMEAARKAREAERKARLAAEEEAQRKKTRTLTPDALKVDVSSQNITAISADEVEAVEPPVAEEKAPKAEPPQAATVKAEPAPAAVKSAAPAPPEPPPAPPVSGKLAEAMVFFKQKKYRDAYNGFAEYLEKNPSGS